MSDLFQNEFTPEPEWSARHNISPRTTARYRQLPNGLPFLVFGGRIYIPIVKVMSGFGRGYAGLIA
jgi:hypothetical protein